MADNVSIKNAFENTISAATDELSDGSQSPKVSMLAGDGSPIPISPATSGKQDTANTALVEILAKLIAAPATEDKQDAIITALAAIVAKLIAAPSTEAKQDDLIASNNQMVPATGCEVVVPSDSVDLTAGPSRAIYVGVSGDVAAVIGGTSCTFVNMIAGTFLPICATRINATGTTAQNLLALY